MFLFVRQYSDGKPGVLWNCCPAQWRTHAHTPCHPDIQAVHTDLGDTLAVYIMMKGSIHQHHYGHFFFYSYEFVFSPDVILCGWLCSKYQVTN